jgi:hypothetical protein
MDPLPFPAKEVESFTVRPGEPLPPLVTSPVLLKGAIDDYPLLRRVAARKTDAEKLSELSGIFGDRSIEFTVMPSAGGRALLSADPDSGRANFSMSSLGKVPFDLFRQHVLAYREGRSPDVPYMQMHPIVEWPAFDELCPTHFAPATDVALKSTWIGPGDHIVNLHYDWYRNFIYMIEGEKRFTLFPPTCLSLLYPAPIERFLNGSMTSLARLLELDLTRYPRLAQALTHAQVATLAPGDVLYVPAMWWHHVESFDMNMTVNTWLYEIPTSDFKELRARFLEGLAVYSGLPPRAVSLFRDMYRAYAFRVPYEPDVTGEVGAHELLEPPALERAVEHLAATMALCSKLPPHWREYLATRFDYFIFRTFGHPYPTLPNYDAETAAAAISSS